MAAKVEAGCSDDFVCFDDSCPPLRCSANKLPGLLRHVRERHAPSEVPSWFVRRWNLKACLSCQLFFKDLSKHSRCRGRAAEPSSDVSAMVNDGDAVGETASDPNDRGTAGRSVGLGHERRTADVGPVAGVQSSQDDCQSEREAWTMVESLSWDFILQTCPHTVTSIRDYLLALWNQALRIPLRCLASNISDEGAWKLLFLLPAMLLSKDSRRGGKKGSGDIKRKFRRFLDFNWKPLLDAVGCPAGSGQSQEHSRQAVLKRAELFVREGELFRAARILTSPGLAPDCEETITRLQQKHPAPFALWTLTIVQIHQLSRYTGM